jgi:hypothetical protein
MLERFYKLKDIIDVLCKQKIIDHTVSEEEFKFIELLLPLLYPFKLFQQVLEAENYVTLSSLPDMINRIRIHLSDIAANATTTATRATSKLDKHTKGTNDTLVNLVNFDENLPSNIGNISKILLEDFNNRWGDGNNAFDQTDIRGYRNRQVGIPKLAFIAAAMDPRMKSLDCMTPSDKDKTWLCVQWLLEEWLLCKDSEPVVQEVTELNNPYEAEEYKLIAQMHSTSSSLSSELQRYKMEPILYKYIWKENKIVGKNNPLKWWQENECKYPNVAKLARAVLCIPATSAPSERVFSTAGRTISAERSRILPDNAADLIFLHDNYDAIPNIFG